MEFNSRPSLCHYVLRRAERAHTKPNTETGHFTPVLVINGFIYKDFCGDVSMRYFHYEFQDIMCGGRILSGGGLAVNALGY